MSGSRVAKIVDCGSSGREENLRHDEDFVQRDVLRGWIILPIAAAVLHLADRAADVAGAFGIHFQAARGLRVFHGLLDAQSDRLGGEKPFLHADGLGKGIAALIGGCGHQSQQRVPIHQPAAGEMAGAGVEQTKLVGGDEDETRLVQTAASGAAEHLEDFIAAQELFLLLAL